MHRKKEQAVGNCPQVGSNTDYLAESYQKRRVVNLFCVHTLVQSEATTVDQILRATSDQLQDSCVTTVKFFKGFGLGGVVVLVWFALL